MAEKMENIIQTSHLTKRYGIENRSKRSESLHSQRRSFRTARTERCRKIDNIEESLPDS